MKIAQKEVANSSAVCIASGLLVVGKNTPAPSLRYPPTSYIFLNHPYARGNLG
jgi:hypothetical protein